MFYTLSMAQDEYGGDLPIESGKSTRIPMLGCPHCPAAFFSNEGHYTHQLERHPDKPHDETWESSPGHQVTYVPNFNRATPHLYVLTDTKAGKHISNMAIGNDGKIEAVQTHSKYRRQGHATELLNAAQEHAETTPGVPTPKFSSMRTSLGDKFQKKAAERLGGEAPKGGNLLSPRQMMGLLNLDAQ